MTAHAESHAAEVGHSGEGHNPRLEVATALKFEPSELHDFELADKAAGQMMGKLLGFLFCVLVTLMAGVNLWMNTHSAKGTDPQAPVEVHAGTDSHSGAAHH